MKQGYARKGCGGNTLVGMSSMKLSSQLHALELECSYRLSTYLRDIYKH